MDERGTQCSAVVGTEQHHATDLGALRRGVRRGGDQRRTSTHSLQSSKHLQNIRPSLRLHSGQFP